MNETIEGNTNTPNKPPGLTRRTGLKSTAVITAATAIAPLPLPDPLLIEKPLEKKAPLNWKETVTDEQLNLMYVIERVELMCQDTSGTLELRKIAIERSIRQIVYH